MNEWPTVRLGDVVQKMNGKIDLEERAGKLCVRGEHIPRQFPPAVDSLVVDDESYLGPAFHRTFESGDVIFATRFPNLNKVGYPSFSGICANTTLVLRADENRLRNSILPYLMKTKSFVNYCILNTRGSTNPYINWTQLANYEFPLPPTHVQERIEHLIKAVAHLYQTSHQYSIELEKFKEKLIEYVYDHTVELSDGFQELNNICKEDVCYGIVQAGPRQEEGVPYIRVSDMIPEIFDYDKILRTTDEISQKHKRSIVSEGEIVICLRGETGLTRIVPKELHGANLTQGTARISPIESINPKYLMWLFHSKKIQREISRFMKGSTFKEISLTDLRKIKIPLAPENMQNIWGELIQDVHKKSLEASERMRLISNLTSTIIDALFKPGVIA
jgi:type I restriction enzyme, S subunit